jgi:hypothetical protein
VLASDLNYDVILWRARQGQRASPWNSTADVSSRREGLSRRGFPNLGFKLSLKAGETKLKTYAIEEALDLLCAMRERSKDFSGNSWRAIAAGPFRTHA